MKLTKTAIYDVLNQLPKSVDAQKLKNQGVEAFSIDLNYRPKDGEVSELRLVYTVNTQANPVNARKVDDNTYHISATYPVESYYRLGTESNTLYRRNIKHLTELIYADFRNHRHLLQHLLATSKNRSSEKQEEYYQQIVAKVSTDSDYMRFLHECIYTPPKDRDEHEARMEFVGNWGSHYSERVN